MSQTKEKLIFVTRQMVSKRGCPEPSKIQKVVHNHSQTLDSVNEDTLPVSMKGRPGPTFEGWDFHGVTLRMVLRSTPEIVQRRVQDEK